MSLGSVVGFVRVQYRGSWVHSGSLVTLGCNLGVSGFIRGGLVQSSSPWRSMASSEVDRLIWERPAGHWVHLGLFGLFGCALGVVMFIWGCWCDSGAPWGSFRCVLGVVGLIPVRPGRRWVHSVLLGSFGCSLGVVGFIRGCWVHSGASLDSFGCALGVVVYIRCCLVNLGTPWGRCVHSGLLDPFGYALWSLGLFRVVGHVRVHPGGHWVCSVSLV